MIREHLDPGRGDVSHTGASQADGEVRSPADVTGSKLVALQKEHMSQRWNTKPSHRENSRGARGNRGGAGAYGAKAGWYGPEGTGLERTLLHVDGASEDVEIEGELRGGKRE